jgi:arginyl-tRNA synthetase
MDEPMVNEQRSRSLYRSGVEQIIENSSLRDGLDTAEAQLLVDWATAQAKAAAYATADFDDDEEAADYLDERVHLAGRLMRLITTLTSQRQRLETADLAALLEQLAHKRADFYEAMGVSNTTVVPPHFTSHNLQQAASSQEAFALLYHYLTDSGAVNLDGTEEE